MNRTAFACLALASLLGASPVGAVTSDNGIIVFTQTDAINGGVTPGDTPGFPVTLSVAGASYRLGSSLTVTSAVNGIEVRANEVKIDMAGFTLAGSGVGRNGITTFNRSLRISDGVVRGFALDGIRSIAPSLTVTDMIVTTNARTGVFADITGSNYPEAYYVRIRNSNISGNPGDGIKCGRSCLVENSVISGNGGIGIYTFDEGAIVLGNSISKNFTGIQFGSLGGAGNNTLISNTSGQISGLYVPMQPNACVPACPPP